MKISYTKKETKNLGNYENVSIEISAEDTVDLDKETDHECYLRLQEFVNTRLNQEMNGKSVNIEEVKKKILNLIENNPNHRIIIKDILKSYNASKVYDLTPLQLKEFNEKLEIL